MKSNKSLPYISSVMILAVWSLNGCANEGGSASLTRAAAKLRPGDVQVMTGPSSSATGSGDQIENKEQSGSEVLRTSAPDWQSSYNLSHAVLGRPDLKDDVARWGVRAILKDANAKIIDTFQQRGLEGTALLKFGDLEGNFTIELSAYEFTKEGPQDQLGSTKIIRIFRDTKSPAVSLEISSSEELQSKRVTFDAKIRARDEDTLAPICKSIQFLSPTEEVIAELPTAPTGAEWSPDQEAGTWSRNTKLDVNLLGSLPVSARVECTDRTGNTATTVLSLPKSTRAEVLPQVQVSPTGRSLSALPRFAADGDSRLFLLENRQLKFDFSLKSGSSVISDTDVFDKKRNELTFVVEAKLASSPESEAPRLIWSGTPESEKIIELPAFMIGAVDLKLTVRDTLATSNDAAVLLVNSNRLFVSPAISSSVTPRLELVSPANLIPAVKNANVTLSARAVSSGLRYGSANFPQLEMTQDGLNWSTVAEVAFAVSRTEAAATGQEVWTISFPYLFDDERPLRLRLRGTPDGGTELVSNLSKRIFGSQEVARQIPALDSPDRLACAAKSKLKVSFASRVACTTRGGSNARIYAVIENHGTQPFRLSGPEGSKVSLGYAAFQGLSQSFAGIIPGTEATLNSPGLLGRQIIALDIPKSYFDGESDLQVLFDRQASGGHSLAKDSYCYQEQEFPTLVLRQDAKLNVTISPFICDDEL
jgi:hypothetical protein